MRRGARILGVVVQGLILGALLFVALTRLLATAGVGTVFRYEGF